MNLVDDYAEFTGLNTVEEVISSEVRSIYQEMRHRNDPIALMTADLIFFQDSDADRLNILETAASEDET